MLVLIITGCSNPEKTTPIIMPGAYSMISQSFKGAAIDTTFTQHKQLKIYTGDYMMYVRLNPADSVSAFGVGTYSTDSGKLTEKIIYSATDTTENTNTFSGTVNITKTDAGYEQVIPEIMSDKGKIRLTEEYKSISAGAESPLDGVWKQDSAYFTVGKDTFQDKNVQYVIFYKGNFAFGYVASDVADKKHTSIVYGTFTLDNSKMKTTVVASSSRSSEGKTFDSEIMMNGVDEYTETNKADNGDKSIVKYKRLKK